MMARVLMFQGTGSDVGKSTLVAGLCRIAARRGVSVVPFKPQNMSNNAAVTSDGGEIGRAQALQARAAGLPLSVHMNPVLLKPTSDRASQVVVHGKALGDEDARQYWSRRDTLMDAVLQSFDHLSTHHDLILVEGAGSPAEINLRARDIANMGFARAVNAPVCLIGDIDRGGVIASLVGTKAVLDPADAAMITGFIVNKFRGDPRLFEDGLSEIVTRTGWRNFGVVPWQAAAARLPSEDAVALDRLDDRRAAKLIIAAPMLSRIANFDDADPLRSEPDVDFRFIPPGQPIPRDADVVMLLGTKSTLGDLAFLRAQGWDHDIHAHVRAGGRVMGICGGYQMLGHQILDPHGVDGSVQQGQGLGLLDVETVMETQKTLGQVVGMHAKTGASLSGYEIHMGTTSGPDCTRPFSHLSAGPDGATRADGRICGTYVHGVFNSDSFRKAWLAEFGVASDLAFEVSIDHALDELADGLEAALDIDALLASAREVEPR
jgi:adenosylcobyric acid synthase